MRVPRPRIGRAAKRVFARGRGRWLALLVSLGVSAGLVYAQISAPPAELTPTAAAAQQHPVGPSFAPAPEMDPNPPPAPSGPTIATQEEIDALAANAPTDAIDFKMELPAGVAPEGGLQVKTVWVARAIGVLFPEVKTIGGYRQDALPWHPNGMALDVMIPSHSSEEGIELGNQIAGMALANARRWGVLHVIWRQKIYPGVGAPSWTADYGNETANHYDHVHIATEGGGYPTGEEVYYISSMEMKPTDSETQSGG